MQIPSRELFEGSFENEVYYGFGSAALVLDVAEPALELERMA